MSHAEATVTSEIGPWGIVPAWVLTVKDESGKHLSGADLRVYIALRSFADRAGAAFPFVHTIAQRANVDKRTCEKSITRLRQLRLVSTTQRRRTDGSIAGCDYRLRDTPPKGAKGVPAKWPVPPGETTGTPRPDDRSKNTPDEHTKETDHDQSCARSARRQEDSPNDKTTAAEIETWRAEDKALFRAVVGESLVSRGHGSWREGHWTADAFYAAFRSKKDPIKWPGRFVESLADVDDWLLDQGLERVG